MQLINGIPIRTKKTPGNELFIGTLTIITANKAPVKVNEAPVIKVKGLFIIHTRGFEEDLSPDASSIIFLSSSKSVSDSLIVLIEELIFFKVELLLKKNKSRIYGAIIKLINFGIKSGNKGIVAV